MKTNVVMETIDRELYGVIVKQRTKDKYFCLNDLNVVASKVIENNTGVNKVLHIQNYFKLEATIGFMKELEADIKTSSYIRGRKGVNSWIHPFLALDFLFWINPKLKLEAYKWLFDNLIDNRISGGDSYKKMCGALFDISSNKSIFHKEISKVAKLIKDECKVSDWNKATKHQLELRDKIQDDIFKLSGVIRNFNQVVRIGIQMNRTEI